jgi:arylformamidase
LSHGAAPLNRLPQAAIQLLILISLFLASGSLAAAEAGLSVVTRDIPYVDQPSSNQTLDVYYRTGATNLPVIVYVHGGGWAFGSKDDVHKKPAYFLNQDVAFISMDYRLRWDYEIYDQAEDVVSVINWVHENAETYGLDKSKIVLMGHAAGAHLVSLVATNASFTKAGGRSLSDITAVVAIDTGSYDIIRLMVELGSFIKRRQHRLVFGSSEQVWREASPINHVAKGKDIPSFALLFVPGDEESTLQARGFAKALSQADVETIMIPGNDKRSVEIDENLGVKDSPTTQALMTFLRAKI